MMRMRWARDVARIWEIRKQYKILAGSPEGKRRLVTSVKVYYNKTGLEGVRRIHLAQDNEK
jgi:hypothetical protein